MFTSSLRSMYMQNIHHKNNKEYIDIIQVFFYVKVFILLGIIAFEYIGKSITHAQITTQLTLSIINSFSGSTQLSNNNTLYTHSSGIYTSSNPTLFNIFSNTGVIYELSGDNTFTTWYHAGTGTIQVPFSTNSNNTIKNIQITLHKWLEVMVLSGISYVLDSLPPTTPTLISPATMQSLSWNIWFARSGNTDTGVWLSGYIFSIGTDPSVSIISYSTVTQLTNASFLVDILANGTYYRKVIAIDKLWNQSISQIYSFTKGNVPNIQVSNPVTSLLWGGGIPLYTTRAEFMDQCSNGDTSNSRFDGLCKPSPYIQNIQSIWNYTRQPFLCNLSTPGAQGAISTYGNEQYCAYIYAYSLDSTSISPIWNAMIYQPVTRGDMAKIISQFATKELWFIPNTNRTCEFNDIQNYTTQRQKEIQIACQLGLMGYFYDGQSPQTSFYPEEPVTRAMFATILSRLLFGEQFNGNKDNRYIDHIQALNRAWIFTKIDNPSMNELRWYAFIVIYRIKNNKNIWQIKNNI